MVKLAGGLARRGYPVDLVLALAEGPHLADIPDAVRLVDLEASRVLTSLPSLIRYLLRERPVAMLSVMNYANIVSLWARRSSCVATRLVVSERNTLSQEVEHTSSQSGALMPWLIKRFYPWADDIVAVSKGVADDLTGVTNLPRERIKVIYNPIVTPEFKEKVEAPVTHPWLDDPQTPVLVAAGRFRPQKGFPCLLRAFAEVRRTRPVRLLLLGDGPDRDALEALVRELGLESDVSLPGFVANPYPYIARATAFVLSSGWEGLPGVLIEALYCGVPLVSTDCPSGPREILADGKYGELVPVGNVPALARAIELALANKVPPPPRESWQPFEQEAVVSQYLNVLLPEASHA